MSLWVDKYRPKEFSNLDYHKKQAEDLQNLTKDGDFPHLLVYGPPGAGKKTRIMCLLRELYGPGVEKLKIETMTVTTPSNKKLEITSVNSNYHIEVNPSDVGMHDRVVIMSVIKTVAQSQQLTTNAQRQFRVVVLTDVDKLTKDAQHALRRTMEKYVANCRLIMCAASISRVIPAIISRCLCIRVPAPSLETVTEILQDTCKQEDFNISEDLAQTIAKMSGRNLRRALLMAQACWVQGGRPEHLSEPDWQVVIRKIADAIVKNQSIETLARVREDLYELINNGIPTDLIFKHLLKELMKNCDVGIRSAVIEEAAIHEQKLSQGNKAIFHLESFVAKVMCIYQNMLLGALSEDFSEEF